MVDAGEAFSAYMDEHFRNLPCKRVQVDEIWSFVYAKAKNGPDRESGPARRWGRLDLDGDLR
jgi:hypothetical protein